MKTFVGHTTSIRYWRAHALEETEGCKVASLSGAVRNSRDLDTIMLYALGIDLENLDILVPREQRRPSSQKVRYRSWTGNLPAGAVRRVRGNIYVLSPEMCFLQFAAEHSLVETILYGLELCGTYATSGSEEDARYQIAPLTRASKLRSFIGRCAGHKGVKTARRALRFIRNGSESPMESAVYLILHLPRALGGYALPAPELNGLEKLNAKERFLGRKASNRCDLFWRGHSLALEYNSDLAHDNDRSIASDALRDIVLGHRGIRVVTLTWEMTRSASEFERVVTVLLKHMRLRARLRVPLSVFLLRRNMLRESVLPRRFRV